MRTKLFLAFFAVILTALISNLIFKRLIIGDFEDYVMSADEDRLYWVLASVEGSHTEAGWDEDALRYYLHWAAMLGFDVEVRDADGITVLTSLEALEDLSPTMRRRMEAIVHPEEPLGAFEEYPLFARGGQIGFLLVRPIREMGLLPEKEMVFKNRGRDFLLISFLIAGGGAVFLSMVFSQFLTRPIKRLKEAALQVAGGDLSVRVRPRSGDEIGRLMKSFNRMVESLEREEMLRQRLTANVAHELRTPLTVMKAHLEAVLDGVVPCDVENARTVYGEVERLITLVEGIEDITKAEASFFKPAEMSDVDLRELVDKVALALRPLFEEKGLTLTMETEEPFPVSTDVEKVEIIFRNILSNALRHTEQGGVWVSCGREKGGFFLSVRDTGPGIPEEERELVFRRFYKGDESTGVGLGLAIARELAELLGGNISMESMERKGTTFRVSLPEGEPE